MTQQAESKPRSVELIEWLTWDIESIPHQIAKAEDEIETLKARLAWMEAEREKWTAFAREKGYIE